MNVQNCVFGRHWKVSFHLFWLICKETFHKPFMQLAPHGLFSAEKLFNFLHDSGSVNELELLSPLF
jgi:hypothetical protein